MLWCVCLILHSSPLAVASPWMSCLFIASPPPPPPQGPLHDQWYALSGVLQDTHQFSLATADLAETLVNGAHGNTASDNSKEAYKSLHESLLIWNANLTELEERADAISRALVIMGDGDFELVGSSAKVGHLIVC